MSELATIRKTMNENFDKVTSEEINKASQRIDVINKELDEIKKLIAKYSKSSVASHETDVMRRWRGRTSTRLKKDSKEQ